MQKKMACVCASALSCQIDDVMLKRLTGAVFALILVPVCFYTLLCRIQGNTLEYVCLEHRRSHTGVFVAIANNTLYGSKLYIFLL